MHLVCEVVRDLASGHIAMCKALLLLSAESGMIPTVASSSPTGRERSKYSLR